MQGITIATFISKNEYENENFYELVEYLKKHIEVEIIIFSNQQTEDKDFKVL